MEKPQGELDGSVLTKREDGRRGVFSLGLGALLGVNFSVILGKSGRWQGIPQFSQPKRG